MFKYWSFGLLIVSEIEFPEFLVHNFTGAPDVAIKLGVTPEKLTDTDVIELADAFITPTAYLLKMDHIANYYITNGKEIVVEPVPGADEKSIRLFLIGNALSAILYQRDLIPLHASAIHYKDSVALFCGPSGAGKSTTLVALQLKGYKIFSDDVCVLHPPVHGDKSVLAIPSYPLIKLWENSYRITGIELEQDEYRLRPELEKYGRFFHNEFDTAAKPISHVFILEITSEITEPNIIQLKPLQAFDDLQKNTYRFVQMSAMRKRQVHFDAISKLTASAKVFKITRPEYGSSVNMVISLIKAALL